MVFDSVCGVPVSAGLQKAFDGSGYCRRHWGELSNAQMVPLVFLQFGWGLLELGVDVNAKFELVVVSVFLLSEFVEWQGG